MSPMIRGILSGDHPVALAVARVGEGASAGGGAETD
jgi:hypothetical protein